MQPKFARDFDWNESINRIYIKYTKTSVHSTFHLIIRSAEQSKTRYFA